MQKKQRKYKNQVSQGKNQWKVRARLRKTERRQEGNRKGKGGRHTEKNTNLRKEKLPKSG